MFRGLSTQYSGLRSSARRTAYGGAGGYRFFLDLVACLSLLLGFWAFPPEFLKGSELAFIRYAGSGAVLSAFLVEVVAWVMAHRTRVAAAGGDDAPNRDDDGDEAA